mgnify:CR=1 FL=1
MVRALLLGLAPESQQESVRNDVGLIGRSLSARGVRDTIRVVTGNVPREAGLRGTFPLVPGRDPSPFLGPVFSLEAR